MPRRVKNIRTTPFEIAKAECKINLSFKNVICSSSEPTLTYVKEAEKYSSKVLSAKIDKIERKHTISKSGTQLLPDVVNNDDIKLATEDMKKDSFIVYPRKWNLVSLNAIATKINLKDVRVAQSELGIIPHHYALNKCESLDIENIHFATNHSRVLKVYHLVTRAVPSMYVSVAEHLLKQFYSLNNSSVDKTTILEDGEIEAMVFTYWKLDTQDIVTWKEDAERKKAKLILTLCYKKCNNCWKNKRLLLYQLKVYKMLSLLQKDTVISKTLNI